MATISRATRIVDPRVILPNIKELAQIGGEEKKVTVDAVGLG